ncbi:divalent metal cation transporter [Nocardioidaceae bacterium]|nr:divalent metal cation transporter [Nocardioidaceae bacterium]
MTQPTPAPSGAEGTDGSGTGGPGVVTRSTILGAIFLMATSAVGPGFLTQTAEYTAQLGAAFAFAILVSVLVDIAVQMNVWRVIGVSGMRAQELGNKVLPGAGWALAGLVVIGGLVFNIGNVAGSGLGTQALLEIDPRVGGAVSAAIAIAIFLSKRAGAALDRIVVVLGVVMLVAALVMTFTSDPPYAQALRESVAPSTVDAVAIVTIIGGTVGGYITYAGAHRLVDSGATGMENVGAITRSSVISIVTTGVMRTILFLAILGVVAAGAELSESDPMGSAFQAAAGEFGLRMYGLILWAAALTSVIGAAYTSVSFLTTKNTPRRVVTALTCGFIVLTAGIFVAVEQTPTTLLIFAGTFNGLILPLGLTLLLWVAWRRRDLMGGYAYPRWLASVGLVGWGISLWIAVLAASELGKL